jgi:hypothetical protein
MHIKENDYSKKLPSNYKLIDKLDLKNDKKIMMKIKIYFFSVIIIMIGASNLLHFPMKNNIGIVKNIYITIIAMVVYTVIHELIHGYFFFHFSGTKPKFLIRAPFVCTGSEAFFIRKHYVLIALAPVFILGVILINMLYFLPTIFFPTLYVITVYNFAGATGDLLQVLMLYKLPYNVLVQDNGKETKMFLPIHSNTVL